jgi:acetyl-CoA carboxylase carboxyltransferase component
MAGGSFRVPVAMLAWPSAEVGAMAPEGAVRLAYRSELAAAGVGEKHDRLYEQFLDDYMASGTALNVASVFEVDDVIDPATTRAWLVRSLRAPRAAPGDGRPTLDTW